ncbi:MAG: DUF3150 domain-containing protein [Anaerolineae bacterium]
MASTIQPQTPKAKSKLVSEARKAVADLRFQIGDQVKAESVDWKQIMQNGVLVRLHIRRWRAQTQIQLEDLGLPQPKDDAERQVYDDLMSLGSKKLLPPETMRKLNALDSGARKHLERYSFKTYWGQFVPVGAYEEWKEGNTKYENDYLDLGKEIVAGWESTMDWMVDAYSVAARQGYHRLLRLNPKALSLKNRRMTEDEFVDAFMSRIRTAIPTKEAVACSFGHETELSYIPLPSQLSADWTEKERIEAERELERKREQVEETAIQDREWALRRMNSDVVADARRRQNELVNQFMADIQTQAMSIIYDGFLSVLESVDKNKGALVGKASAQIKNTIDLWRSMNLSGNQELEGQINRMAGLIGKAPKDRSAGEIQSLLKDIATAARGNMVTLGATPRSGRSVGIPDQVQPLELRRAKRSVQLEMEAE